VAAVPSGPNWIPPPHYTNLKKVKIASFPEHYLNVVRGLIVLITWIAVLTGNKLLAGSLKLDRLNGRGEKIRS
jgi:hypothetical protein